MRALYSNVIVAVLLQPASALLQPPRPLTRRTAIGGFAAALAPLLPATADDDALPALVPPPELVTARGNGFVLGVPSSYYKQKSRPQVGPYDDTVFVAADYAAGRTASVTKVDAATFLVDSGDPLPLQAGAITSLKDLGKPAQVAKALAGRREGDPQGLQPPQSEVRDAVRDGENTLTFTLLSLRSTATSLTTASPAARRTVARTTFVPGGAGGGTLLTVWATSDAIDAKCEVVPCPECTGLRCACPPPKCDAGSSTPSAIDEAIIRSLNVLR